MVHALPLKCFNFRRALVSFCRVEKDSDERKLENNSEARLKRVFIGDYRITKRRGTANFESLSRLTSLRVFIALFYRVIVK